MFAKDSYTFFRHCTGFKLAALTSSLFVLLSACGGGDSSSPAGTGSTTAPLPAATSITISSSGSSSSPSGTSSTSSATVDLPAAQTCSLPNFGKDLLARVNAERAAGATCGTTVKPAVAALAWNSKLTEAAKLHSQDMIDRSFFDHVNPSGVGVDGRVTAQGYSWSTVGENIAAGQRGVTEVMDAWMKSSGHCNNIMNGNFTEIGVACVIAPNDPRNYGFYWTMVLAKPR